MSAITLKSVDLVTKLSRAQLEHIVNDVIYTISQGDLRHLGHDVRWASIECLIPQPVTTYTVEFRRPKKGERFFSNGNPTSIMVSEYDEFVINERAVIISEETK